MKVRNVFNMTGMALVLAAALFIALAACSDGSTDDDGSSGGSGGGSVGYTVSTFAGGQGSGYKDGMVTAAQFFRPSGVAVDSAGNVYVADAGNKRIRKITSAGVVSTFAGKDSRDYGEDIDGTGTEAYFYGPRGIAMDGPGNIYVADGFGGIRKISSAGTVTTIAEDDTANVAIDSAGNIYFVDVGNQRIRKITSAGVVSTFAGNGTRGYMDGTGATAQFDYPNGVAVDSTGNVYVADSGNHCIRKINSAGMVSTFAGNGIQGFIDGPGQEARFISPQGMAVDSAGNIYVTDYNNCIRKISSAGMVTTIAGNTPNGGYSSGYKDGPGQEARFSSPQGMAVDGAGNIYVADSENHSIRKLIPQ
jgi:sugar lactone lactonase YvrE